MRRRYADCKPAALAMHFDDATRNAVELTRDQHTRLCSNLLAQSYSEFVDALPAFGCDRGARRAHHADLYQWSWHGSLQRHYVPTTPSITSRSRSAWPLCRAYSSIICTSTQRTDGRPGRASSRPNVSRSLNEATTARAWAHSARQVANASATSAVSTLVKAPLGSCSER